MPVISASFFWKNDKPGGLGLEFGPPDFAPHQLADLFGGDKAERYMRESDAHLGDGVVQDYLDQLATIARDSPHIPIEMAVIAALNIMWLTRRGFIPDDEFNGILFVGHF